MSTVKPGQAYIMFRRRQYVQQKLTVLTQGFPGHAVVKNMPASAGEARDLGRFPGEGDGNPLQHSRLENPMDRGAWWATVHGVAKNQTRLKRLSTDACSNPGAWKELLMDLDLVPLAIVEAMRAVKITQRKGIE